MHDSNIPHFSFKHKYSKNCLFPSTVAAWTNLDSYKKNSLRSALFKKCILVFLR